MMPSSKTYQFGPFTFDAVAGDLQRDGRTTRLRRQTALLLTALLEQDGDVLTREEITALLWADDVHVDTESGINFVARQLRTALQDDAAAPQYLETLPRRGYRLLVAVTEKPKPADEPGIGPAPQHRSKGSTWTRWSGWITAAVVLLVVSDAQPHRTVPRLLVEFGTDAAGSRHFDRDGMRDMLIAALNQPPRSFDVIAPQVADDYLNRPFPEVRKALALDLLLHVSVQDADGQPRVHAKLVHAANGRIIWSLNRDYPVGALKSSSRAFTERVAAEVRRALSAG
jgi:transcriptional activator of cad operon